MTYTFKRIALILGLALFLLVDHCLTQIQAVEDLDEQASTVSLTILPSSHLRIIDDLASETLIQDSSAEDAFDAGFVELEPDKPTLIVNINKKWKLTAKTSGFTGPYAKGIGDLMLKDAGRKHVRKGFKKFKALTAKDQAIASHKKGVRDEEHPCQYKILLDWTKDLPGTYEATVTYTLTTPGT